MASQEVILAVGSTGLLCSIQSYFPLWLCTPIDNTLECDCGISIGGYHFRDVRGARRGIWAVLINKARRPLGARKVTAWGRMVSKRSTARRVTTSAWEKSVSATTASARSMITLTSVNVRARATSFRKAAFL